MPPTLAWSGRRFSPGEDLPRARGLGVTERYPGPGPAQRVIHGDALAVASELVDEELAGKVDLVYVDPPFFSGADYIHEARLDGSADGRLRRAVAYDDRWRKNDGGLDGYLESLGARLDALSRLLSPTGTFWVHLDWRASYLVRVLMDEILGRDAFLNEIVWRRAPNLGRQAQSNQFGRTLDTIVVYGKSGAVLHPPTRLEPIEESAIRRDDEGRAFTTAPRGDYTDLSIAKLDREGRVHRTATGKIYIKYFLVADADGRLCRERRVDALWTDVPPLRHVQASERTGFPTQKPRALLERILLAGSPPGGLAVDAYGGSGTLAEAAHVTGRRAIHGDASALSIATARSRLLRAGANFTVERCKDMECPSIDVSVSANAGEVRLERPEEPLAWAVGEEVLGTFVARSSAVRGLGKKALPASLALPKAGKESAVRVFGDEGGVGRATVSAEAKPKAKASARAARAEGEDRA